jgi:hypothetical protein
MRGRGLRGNNHEPLVIGSCGLEAHGLGDFLASLGAAGLFQRHRQIGVQVGIFERERDLDRIDIHIEVPAVKYKELRAPASAEDSAAVRGRGVAARERQMERFRGEKRTYANAQMMPKSIRKHCAISAEGEKLLESG